METRNYSPRTVKCYVSMLASLALYYHQSPDCLTIGQVKKYLHYCKQEKGLSVSTINQTISALKILRQDVLGKPWEEIKIKRPRKNRHLPDILSREEIARMIHLTDNPKHKAIIALLYSTGVRREEFLNLRISDIDPDRMLVRVRNGKGNKARDTLLAQNTLKLLRDYYHFSRPREYLFESYRPGVAYSATSVKNVVRRAAQRAGIAKHICIHSLRHAFATHLLEEGTNLKVIQKLLGHTSLRSTAIYLHLAKVDFNNVHSPLDYMEKTI